MRRLLQIMTIIPLAASMNAQSSFPTCLPVEEYNVEWERDVYRIIDLNDNENAGLGASNIPNLFTILFEMAVEGDVPIYGHVLNGNETFSEKEKTDIKDVLESQEIPYSVENGKLLVEEEDIPTTEVKMYYVKESVYYDGTNGTFRKRIKALCPVLTRADDFNEDFKYPLFWVLYEDAEPFLKNFYIHTTNYNKRTRMSVSEYLAKNLYKGEIYKVFNAQGLTLSQYCETDTLMEVERKKIEREISTVRSNTYIIPEEEVKENPNKKVINRPKRLRLFRRAKQKDIK